MTAKPVARKETTQEIIETGRSKDNTMKTLRLTNTPATLLFSAGLLLLGALAAPDAGAQSSGGTGGYRPFSGQSSGGGIGAGTSRSTGTASSGRASASGAAGMPGGSANINGAVIQYDSETGNIIVITDEDTNTRIRQVIEQLDQPAPQVMIKALFVELTRTNDLDIGVTGSLKSTAKTVGKDSSGKAITVQDSIASLFGKNITGFGGSLILQQKDWQMAVNALEQTGKLNVLSRPSVLARNNEQAVFTVGQSVPLITDSRVTAQNDTINTVEYKDVGITLDVTPFIRPDGAVEMDVSPTISTLTGDSIPTGNGAQAPVIAKRAAQSKIIVPTACTAVMGGLLQDKETKNVTKVPILGSIPVLGALFRRTVKSTEKTELLIFLTPEIVRDGKGISSTRDAEALKMEKVNPDISAETRELILQEFVPPASKSAAPGKITPLKQLRKLDEQLP